MTKLILLYLLTVNAIGFLLMLGDKRMAQKKLWRIPESTLMMATIIGGSVGCLIGMYTFRHKTRHLKFTLGVPAILIAQIVIVFLLIR
jgi:uncharacterized membrane protein YsdA (DUF1294 family)